NLFEMATDPVPIEPESHEFEVVADRNRRLEFEIFQVKAVTGFGLTTDQVQQFLPFFYSPASRIEKGAFFIIRRQSLGLSQDEIKDGPVSSYLGSETFLSLVDTEVPPFSPSIRAVTAEVLCTNRHLPLRIPTLSDLRSDNALPCSKIQFLSERSNPQP